MDGNQAAVDYARAFCRCKAIDRFHVAELKIYLGEPLFQRMVDGTCSEDDKGAVRNACSRFSEWHKQELLRNVSWGQRMMYYLSPR